MFEITPDGLPKGLPPKEFGKQNVCRNPLIASLLLRCEYIERMGTGMDRIHDALKDEHCPPVDIRYDTMFTLEFRRPAYFKQKDREETPGKTRGKTSDLILEKLTSYSEMTLSELGGCPRIHFCAIFVIPAKAGIQSIQALIDSRLRGNDAMSYSRTAS